MEGSVHRVRRGQRATWCAAFLMACALCAAAFPTGSASAEPSEPTDLAQLEQAFQVQSVPSDYVVVVDTSASMVEGPEPLFPKVREAHAGLIDQIPDNAYLSVVTFDSVARVGFNGPLLGANRLEAKILPDANGQATDIGAALDSALNRLDRPDAAPTQTVIFVTDGRHDAPDASVFREPGNAAWTTARERATKLAETREIAVRALGLGDQGKAGAELVLQVFPKTEVVQLAGDQLGGYLVQEAANARRRSLAASVRDEIVGGSVTVKVTAPEGLDNEVPAEVELTNGLGRLGVDVDLRLVTAADNNGKSVRVSIVDGSRVISLPPGGTSSFEVLVKPDIEPGPLVQLPPPEREELDITLKLDGTAVARPTDIIRNDLGVDPSVKVLSPDQFTVGRDVGVTWRTFFLRLGMLVLAILLAIWIWNRYIKRQKLCGFIVRRAGQTTEVLTALKGKSMRISPNTLGIGTSNDEVEIFTKRFRGTKVFAKAKSGRCNLEMSVARRTWTPVEQGSVLPWLTPLRINDSHPFELSADPQQQPGSRATARSGSGVGR